jgi:hypothetical protein
VEQHGPDMYIPIERLKEPLLQLPGTHRLTKRLRWAHSNSRKRKRDEDTARPPPGYLEKQLGLYHTSVQL